MKITLDPVDRVLMWAAVMVVLGTLVAIAVIFAGVLHG